LYTCVCNNSMMMAFRCWNLQQLMYVMCVVLQSASVGWYVDCKNMHGVKNIKHAGMQLGCQSNIQEVAVSQCGRCPTHITILFRKLSFNTFHVRHNSTCCPTYPNFMFPTAAFSQILCTFCMIPDNACNNNVYFPRFYNI